VRGGAGGAARPRKLSYAGSVAAAMPIACRQRSRELPAGLTARELAVANARAPQGGIDEVGSRLLLRLALWVGFPFVF
jgi:hypothetical protein